MIGGMSLVLLVVAAMVSVQYTVRMRLRRSGQAREQTAGIPTTSVAFQPVQQLRSSHLLLEFVLPRIEQVSGGVTSTAEQTRVSLEHTARQVVLQEQVIATLTARDSDAGGLADMRRSLQVMADGLRSGVDRYTDLAQKASMVAVSLGGVSDRGAIRDATDQLTGLAQGLQEVQRISDGNC